MHKIKISLPLLAAALVVGQLFLVAASPLAADDAANARKTRILANLQLAFPQLKSVSVTMGDITATEFAGLDQGEFVVNGQQHQKFLVSHDDKKFYIVALEPIDVSRDEEGIKAEVARQEAEKAKQADERKAELAAAISGLPTRGNPDGAVTIVEFSDFQCPFCARGAETVEQILAKYPERVRFVFKNFPLSIHPWAMPAAIAAHCAAEQSPDAFWALHDGYFKNQREINPENVLAKSKEYLKPTGIDLAKWSTCAEEKDSDAYKAAAAAINADMAFGQKLGVSGTPGFFVNGEFLNGAQPLAVFEPLIDGAPKTES